jgi:hypothetical protein
MRTATALGIAVLLTVAVIVGWGTRTASYTDQAKAVTAPAAPVVPFELMKQSNGLPQQHYDAF